MLNGLEGLERYEMARQNGIRFRCTQLTNSVWGLFRSSLNRN